MEILLDFFVALFAAFGVLGVIWCVGCALTAPPRKGEQVTAVVTVRGSASELMRHLDPLQRLRRQGFRNMQIVVADDGLDPEAAALAARLAEAGEISLCGFWNIFRRN